MRILAQKVWSLNLTDMSTNRKIFITLFLAVFATTMGAGIVAPLLPVYANELGAGAIQIGMIFAGFSLTRSIFVPYFGKLSDRKGKKVFLTTGLLIYAFLSLLYVASSDVASLILLRLAQGIASAMILPVAHAYVGLITPVQQEGRTMGLFNISLYAGLSAGPVFGGMATDWFSINVAFVAMGVLAIMGWVLCLMFLPRETRPENAGAGAVTSQISYRKLLAVPSVYSLFAFRFCYTTCIGVVWAFIPLVAHNRFGLSASAIGWVVMINVFVSALLQTPMGRLADRYSKKILVTIGGMVAILSLFLFHQASSLSGLILANALLGLGGGISFPAIMAQGVIEGRRAGAMGSLMGLLALAHSAGMFTGPLLAGIYIDFFSMNGIFVVASVVLAAGILLFLRLDNS